MMRGSKEANVANRSARRLNGNGGRRHRYFLAANGTRHLVARVKTLPTELLANGFDFPGRYPLDVRLR